MAAAGGRARAGESVGSERCCGGLRLDGIVSVERQSGSREREWQPRESGSRGSHLRLERCSRQPSASVARLSRGTCAQRAGAE
eukprot:5865838-Prymnesium_polylepis.1